MDGAQKFDVQMLDRTGKPGEFGFPVFLSFLYHSNGDVADKEFVGSNGPRFFDWFFR
jgi:hypothetical protein